VKANFFLPLHVPTLPSVVSYCPLPFDGRRLCFFSLFQSWLTTYFLVHGLAFVFLVFRGGTPALPVIPFPPFPPGTTCGPSNLAAKESLSWFFFPSWFVPLFAETSFAHFPYPTSSITATFHTKDLPPFFFPFLFSKQNSFYSGPARVCHCHGASYFLFPSLFLRY